MYQNSNLLFYIQLEVWRKIEDVSMEVNFLDELGSLVPGYGVNGTYFPLHRPIVFLPKYHGGELISRKSSLISFHYCLPARGTFVWPKMC